MSSALVDADGVAGGIAEGTVTHPVELVGGFGEDLGTVEDGVREAMAEHGVLSYRLLWFEEDEPSTWPAEAMAAISTHDLPTVAGLVGGADIAEQREHGTGTDEELERGRTTLLAQLPGLDGDASAEEAVELAHRLLARAPSLLLSATLDDAVGDHHEVVLVVDGSPDRTWDVAEQLAAVRRTVAIMSAIVNESE